MIDKVGVDEKWINQKWLSNETNNQTVQMFTLKFVDMPHVSKLRTAIPCNDPKTGNKTIEQHQ